MTGDRETRFMADCMLGRLARWLRILGHDVAYERAIADDALIARCRREGRALLTCDTALAARRALRENGTQVILVAAQRAEDQLAQVLRETGYGLASERLLTRCLACNEPLREEQAAAVKGRVPPYVLATQTRFSSCPACGRIYWPATHVWQMRARLARLDGPSAVTQK
jgi:uncharacterized protein with PIN domain